MGKDMFEKSIYQIYLINASSSGMSCEHENRWYADVYRREMELERLKMFARMLEEINDMEYAICGASSNRSNDR